MENWELYDHQENDHEIRNLTKFLKKSIWGIKFRKLYDQNTENRSQNLTNCTKRSETWKIDHEVKFQSASKSSNIYWIYFTYTHSHTHLKNKKTVCTSKCRWTCLMIDRTINCAIVNRKHCFSLVFHLFAIYFNIKTNINVFFKITHTHTHNNFYV